MRRIPTTPSLPVCPEPGRCWDRGCWPAWVRNVNASGRRRICSTTRASRPVTKRSGGSCYIHRRYLCPKFHKQSFHEYAKESILWSRWAAAYYLQQRIKGCPHHTAVRALAFKWQRIIWRCWQNRTPYQEAIYEAALRKSGSPLGGALRPGGTGQKSLQKPGEKILKNPLTDYLRGELSHADGDFRQPETRSEN